MTTQVEAARERANRVKRDRVGVKRRLRAGEVTLAEALEHECCQTMTVFQLLCAQYGWGRERTVRVLSRLQISELRHVGLLTDRQRALLVEACGGRRDA